MGLGELADQTLMLDCIYDQVHEILVAFEDDLIFFFVNRSDSIFNEDLGFWSDLVIYCPWDFPESFNVLSHLFLVYCSHRYWYPLCLFSIYFYLDALAPGGF